MPSTKASSSQPRRGARLRIAAAALCLSAAAGVAQADSHPRTQEGPVYLAELPLPPKLVEQKRAFDAVAVVRCDTCPGGQRDDGDLSIMLSQRFSERQPDAAAVLGRIRAGEGTAYGFDDVAGMVLHTSDADVAGLPCRWFRQSLSHGARRAERDRLICWGRRDAKATEDAWVLVF